MNYELYNMAVTYEIRQQVETIYKKWLVAIYETPIERIAKYEFDKIIKDHPKKYFELVSINLIEDCMKFTPICSNCDTPLPEGCGGIFKADGEHCKYGV